MVVTIDCRRASILFSLLFLFSIHIFQEIVLNPFNSSSFMNECVAVKVVIRLAREIGLSEVFLTLRSSECTIVSCKTLQDGEGRKMVVIGVEGINVSIRVKNLPSPQ